MTIDLREPTTGVPPCHYPKDDDQQKRDIVRVQPATHDDSVSIAWRPSKRQLVIGGGMLALAIVVAAAFVFNISPGNLAVFALVLACPLMHVFMMRGMGHGGQHGGCHGSQQSGTETGAQKKDDKA